MSTSASSQVKQDSIAEGAAPVLEELLASASIRGEKAVALARLIIGSLGMARMLFFGGWSGLVAGSPKFLVIFFGLALGIGWSILQLTCLRPDRTLQPKLAASVIIEALVLLSVGLCIGLWPSPTYPGFLRIPEASVFVLAMATPGLRLSRGIALLGSGALAAVQLALMVIDSQIVPERLTYGSSEYVLWAAVNLGATVLGLTIAAVARRLVYRGADAALKAERARQRLGLYVSEEVARAALETDVLEVGGRRQRVAVLFSDLRDFTAYSETLPPEKLVEELNEYLDHMVGVVRDHGGVVDKFIGDAIMAVFGIPTEQQSDASAAVRCAAAMQQALEDLNRQRAARGRPPLRQGIGIHWGVAIAGNIGNSERLQYTVVGSVVNMASRLEAATKDLHTAVLISSEAAEAARAAADAPAMRSLGRIEVRGHEGEVEVFSFVGPRAVAEAADEEPAIPAALEIAKG